MPTAEFESAIPTVERPQTYAMYRTAHWIGYNLYAYVYFTCVISIGHNLGNVQLQTGRNI
jgi:hypothetical protein